MVSLSRGWLPCLLLGLVACDQLLQLRGTPSPDRGPEAGQDGARRDGPPAEAAAPDVTQADGLPSDLATPDAASAADGAVKADTSISVDFAKPTPDQGTPAPDQGTPAPDQGTPAPDQGTPGWQVISPTNWETLRDVWGYAGKLVVTGTNGIWERKAGAWTKPVTGVNLARVRIDPGTGVGYAVGANGAIYHHAGGVWTDTGQSGVALAAVLVKGPSGVAVGTKGVLRQGTGASWTTVTTGLPWSGTSWLTAIWGVSTSDYWVAAGTPPFWHHSYGTWTDGALTAYGTFTAMSGTGTNDVYAVSTGGSVAHFDGTTWSEVHNAGNATLRDVWAAGPSEVYAVGDKGLVLRYDGVSWDQMSVPAAVSNVLFNGVWGPGPGEFYAVGELGTVLHHVP